MLRKWGRRCISATRNSCAYRARGRSAYSIVPSRDATKTAATARLSELRVGVLGLGAIGTIFFTRLGLLTASLKAKKELPILRVDAFVKPEQFDSWMATEKLQLCLEEQKKEALAFQVDSEKKVATVLDDPNVRVLTLESAGEDDYSGNLDVLLVAVKAYDSAGVIRELRDRNRNLLKDDALCVLLQNGLGEVPEEEGRVLRRVDDRWQFVNGVTFIGGQMVEFGRVVTSGLDAGMTYLAPFGGCDDREPNSSEEGILLRKERDIKMEMLARMLVAAGLRCEVLEASKMQAVLWRKLIVNAAINPLASLLDAPNRSIISSKGSRHCVDMVVQEALAVAKRERIPLTCSQNVQELVDEILEVARNTDTNVCSMLADLRRGSRTEVDAITGRIVAGGKQHGIPTPANEILLSLVKALEEEGTRRIE